MWGMWWNSSNVSIYLYSVQRDAEWQRLKKKLSQKWTCLVVFGSWALKAIITLVSSAVSWIAHWGQELFVPCLAALRPTLCSSLLGPWLLCTSAWTSAALCATTVWTFLPCVFWLPKFVLPFFLFLFSFWSRDGGRLSPCAFCQVPSGWRLARDCLLWSSSTETTAGEGIIISTHTYSGTHTCPVISLCQIVGRMATGLTWVFGRWKWSFSQLPSWNIITVFTILRTKIPQLLLILIHGVRCFLHMLYQVRASPSVSSSVYVAIHGVVMGFPEEAKRGLLSILERAGGTIIKK